MKTKMGTLFFFGGAAVNNYFNPKIFKLNKVIQSRFFWIVLIDVRLLNLGEIA